MLSQLKWFVLSTILTGSLASAQAQPAPLSLDDCINQALGAPSQASVAEIRTAVSGEERTIARSALLPQVNFGTGFLYNSPLKKVPDQFSFVAANGIREYLFLVDSTWEVDFSGRLQAGLALAQAHRNLAEADLHLTRRELRRAVAVAFFDVLLARRLVELEGAGVHEAKDFESRTRARQAQGEASMADVHKAAAQLSRAEQRLSQARLDARLANQVLASFWTSDVDRELQLADDLEVLPPLPTAIAGSSAAAVGPAIQARPEFARLDALQSGYEAEGHAARAALFPQAELVFQYGIDSNSVSFEERGYAAFVRLKIPVFDWFHSKGGMRQADFRNQQTMQEREMAERTFTREYLAAQARVESWYERVPIAQRELADARESLRLSRLLYESGEGLALDVVAAQTEVTDAGTAYFSALTACRRSVIDFEVAAGQ